MDAKDQRITSAIVANYIHELSERHGETVEDDAAEPEAAAS